MPTDSFKYTRLEGRQKHRTTDLGQAMRCPDITQERWLFVSPHDDDACMGAGLWLQAALGAGVEAYLLVVTDGRMGYCRLDEIETIIETRRMETYDSCAILGLDQKFIRYIDYPDGGLSTLQGRQAKRERPEIEDIHGYVGLQNAMTYYLRTIKPQRVILPTPTDLHPDHRITHSEMMISLFHASGEIWPELGPPTELTPKVYEMAVYCEFAGPPNLELCADQAAFDQKLASIAAFQSQAQIAQLIDNVRKNGPYEYLRETNFHLYTPNTYLPLFI